MANNTIALLSQAPVLDTPVESQSKALQIRSMMNQGQVQDMEMQQRRQAMKDDSIARDAFAANPTDSSARLAALARAPKAYAAERTALQNAEKVTADIGQTKANTKKAEIEGAIKTMDAAGQALGFVVANPTMENAISTLDYLGRNGIYSPEDVAHYRDVITKDPTQIKALAEQAFRGALAAKDQLAKIDTRNLGNRMETRSIDPITGKETVLGSQAIGQSPDNAASVGASYANAAATREIAKATRDAASIRRDQETEMKLGDDYRTQSKSFKEAGEAYRTINSTLDKATTSPAATLASATKFMKLLDPGSVVRESELGMALAATGVIDRAFNYFNTLKSGKVLTPSQVKDFKDITEQIYGAAQAGQRDIDASYTQQANQYKLRPEMIVQDLGQNAKPAPKGAPAQVTNASDYAKVPSGAEYMAPDGQLRRKP